MAIELSKLPYEHREILLRDKPSSMLEASPKGTVPVLKLVDDTVVDESLDIMHWAFKVSNNPLQTVSDEETKLIHTNDTFFKKKLDNYKYANRFADKEEEMRTQSLNKALEFLSDLNKRLEKNEFLTGNEMKLADVAIFPFVRQFSKVNENTWEELNLKSLNTWLNKFLNSQSFENIMKKYPLWSEKSEPLLINKENN